MSKKTIGMIGFIICTGIGCLFQDMMNKADLRAMVDEELSKGTDEDEESD